VHEALNPDMVEMLAGALDQTGNRRGGTMARQVIDYHTTPVEVAEIAKEAGVPHLPYGAAAQEHVDAAHVHAGRGGRAGGRRYAAGH
jgi:hypothetical protein